MAPKRKNNQPEGPTGRDKKKLKLATARTIEVQSTTTETVPTNQNAVAGPSRLITTDSKHELQLQTVWT